MNRDFSDLSVLPRRIQPITLLDRGVMRAGMPVYRGEKQVGWVTSGTMVPYYVAEGEGLQTVITDETAKRAIGLCYIDSDILTDDTVEVDIRGKRLKAVIPANHMSVSAPPFARPLLYRPEEKEPVGSLENLPGKAFELLKKAEENHLWRQKQCINLIPSENTPSHAVQMLSASDPSCRYAEHKKVLSFYDKDIFYYQGTKFIDEVERLLVEQMRLYLGCAQVETRVVSGQMSNMATFSALMDWKNRLDRKHTPQRLGYVMNNHIIKGGHLSAQPMGALKDYIAVDPVTERTAVVNFPVCRDDLFRIDVEETKKVIDRYRPELIIFGKSMVLRREPVAEIRRFVTEQNIPTTIMYDMAHVLGLVGDHFQKPFEEGFRLVIAHIDSPRLDLRPNPLYEANHLSYFKTHYYGGIRKYQWGTMPLAIHGVFTRADGSSVSFAVGEDENDPVFCITDLLPHLGAEQNDRKLSEGIKAEELNVLIGSDAVEDADIKEAVKLNTLMLLHEKYGITERDFTRAEIEVVPAHKARDVGFDRSMVGGYGHDDRVDAYPALMAEIETKDPVHTTVCVLTDKEEIGSDGVTGMQSMYVFHFMQLLCRAAGQDDILAFQNSVCLSADVTAAYDPSWANAFEPQNGTYAGRGVAFFKYTGSRGKSSASDASAELVGDITCLLDANGVAWQIGELGRLDLGGGGTIAKYVANRGIPVLDIGVPVLSMHSPFEVIHKTDLYMAYRTFSLFCQAEQ